jgi:hypothetical protein
MKAVSDEQVDALTSVVCDVLEASAFSFADPCAKDELPEARGDLFEAEITFSGEKQQGTIRLAAPAELAAVFSAEMLALDRDEVSDLQAADALKELLNVVCGQWLTAVWGVDPVFRLTVPQMKALTDTEWRSICERPGARALVVDGIPLSCELGWSGRATP